MRFPCILLTSSSFYPGEPIIAPSRTYLCTWVNRSVHPGSMMNNVFQRYNNNSCKTSNYRIVCMIMNGKIYAP